MDTVTTLLAAGLLCWLGLFALLLALRALQPDGTVMSRGVWYARDSSRRVETDVAPERVLLSSLFPAFVVYYVFTALTAPEPVLPDIPQEFLLLLTGGNGLYMAGTLVRARTHQKGDST